MSISDEEFTRIWQSSNSARDAIAKMGLSSPSVYARVNKLRKRGVRLKAYSQRSGLPTATPEALNRIIDEMAAAESKP